METNVLDVIGQEYVSLLLEGYGCKVNSSGGAGGDHTLEVWSPKGYEKASALIRTLENRTESISLLIARIINDRKIPIVVDYHIVKICGEDGAYSVDDSVVQQILLDNRFIRVYTGDDGSSIYVECKTELLLDCAMKIEEKVYRPFLPIKHVQSIGKVEKGKIIK